KDRVANENALRTNLLSLQTTRTRHVGNDPNVDRYDPDLWTDEFAFLNQPVRHRFKAIYFTIIEPTLTPIRSGRHGCARNSRACSSFGVSTISHSTRVSRNTIVTTCR